MPSPCPPVHVRHQRQVVKQTTWPELIAPLHQPASQPPTTNAAMFQTGVIYSPQRFG
jgi:hypothetical protein